MGVLLELHGAKRLRFNDDQRRRLAVKGSTLEPGARQNGPGLCASVGALLEAMPAERDRLTCTELDDHELHDEFEALIVTIDDTDNVDVPCMDCH